MTNKFKKKLLLGGVIMVIGGMIYYSTTLVPTLDITFLKIIGVAVVGLGSVIVVGE